MKLRFVDLSKVERRAVYFAFTPYLIFTEDETGSLLYFGLGSWAIVLILKDGNFKET